MTPTPHSNPAIDDLKSSVAAGAYVVDPVLVADALLRRLALREDAAGSLRLSPDGARSPRAPAPRRPGC